VQISDGSTTVDLIELNFNNLADSLKDLLLDLFQLSANEIVDFDYIIYTTPVLLGEIGKEYTLTVEKDQHLLTAVTTIPEPVIPDSIWSEHHEDPNNDSLMYYRFSFEDPPVVPNYYRFFTQRNNEPFYTNLFVSLMDDKLQNGQRVSLPLLRGSSKFDEFDPVSFGAFKVGDQVTMKFCSIDEAHYNFWSTLSTDQFSGGPFASPVNIKSNVNGGLGVWGGYGAYYYTFIVQ
nr:DUF4249 family protein [Bacteroidota bacterium]